MKKIISILIVAFLSMPFIRGQEAIQVEPLFEYPVAPEELTSLSEKCNYLVKNFWNDFDFKSKKPVDQYALNEAFMVYVTAFRYADYKEVMQSVDHLIKEISSHPIYLLQFGKAAEENLYGPRADFWSDEVYLKFLDAIIKNKKVSPQKKTRYQNQASALRESAIGQNAPSFWFENPHRASKQYFPMSTPTLIIFGDPDDTDWRIERVKMESNLQLDDAIKKGKVNVIFIVANPSDNWQELVSNYNSRWTVGISPEAPLHYDIRIVPSIFLVDANGKILNKALDPETAVTELLNLIN